MNVELLWAVLLGLVVCGPLISGIVCPTKKGKGEPWDRRLLLPLVLLVVLASSMVYGLGWAFRDPARSVEAATADASAIYFTWFGLTVALAQSLLAGHPKFLRVILNLSVLVLSGVVMFLGVRVGGGFVTPLTIVMFVVTIAVALVADWTSNRAPRPPEPPRRRCHLAPKDV